MPPKKSFLGIAPKFDCSLDIQNHQNIFTTLCDESQAKLVLTKVLIVDIYERFVSQL